MPPNPPAPTTASHGGQWIQIVERDPQTVCAPYSILVCALRTVGVQLHPSFAFTKITEDRGTFWRWLVSPKSKDGLYQTGKLIEWWNDPAWLKANPQHEWAILRAGLHNMAIQAGEIRDTVGIVVVRKGKSEAHIPENASEALRQFRLDQLDGKIPFNAIFTEPPAAPEPSAAA